jgi:hypothetical protein
LHISIFTLSIILLNFKYTPITQWRESRYLEVRLVKIKLAVVELTVMELAMMGLAVTDLAVTDLAVMDLAVMDLIEVVRWVEIVGPVEVRSGLVELAEVELVE